MNLANFLKFVKIRFFHTSLVTRTFRNHATAIEHNSTVAVSFDEDEYSFEFDVRNGTAVC